MKDIRTKLKEKFWRFMSFLDNVLAIITLLAIGVLFLLMCYGAGKKILDPDFIKYFITASFVMSGFTFNAFFQKERHDFRDTTISSCYSFIISSFLLLSFFIIPAEILPFNFILGVAGIFFFLLGFLILVLGVYLEVRGKITFKKK